MLKKQCGENNLDNRCSVPAEYGGEIGHVSKAYYKLNVMCSSAMDREGN